MGRMGTMFWPVGKFVHTEHDPTHCLMLLSGGVEEPSPKYAAAILPQLVTQPAGVRPAQHCLNAITQVGVVIRQRVRGRLENPMDYFGACQPAAFRIEFFPSGQ